MKNKILQDLLMYLGEGEEALLSLLINRAIANVKVKRNYPNHWDEDMIDDDLENYQYVIFDAVVYAYGKMGAEGQQSHSENGISRSWIDEGKLYADVIPFVTVL